MHKEGKLITAEEVMCRLGQAMEQMKEYVDGRFLEYHPVEEEYVFPYDIPSEPAPIYVYKYKNGPIYFTHTEQPNNNKYGELTNSWTFNVGSRYWWDSEESEANVPWGGISFTHIESDPIRAPKYMDCFFWDLNITDTSFLEKWETSDVESLDRAFKDTTINETSGMAHWNMKSLKSMYYIFHYVRNDIDLSGLRNWDVSNLQNMSAAFYLSNITNVEPLSEWNTSSVTDMSSTFYSAGQVTSFEPLDKWDVSNVTKHGGCFGNTTGALPKWADSSWK